MPISEVWILIDACGCLVSTVWLSPLAPNKVKLRQKNQRRDFPALSFGSIEFCWPEILANGMRMYPFYLQDQCSMSQH